MTGSHMTVPKEPEIEIPDFIEPTRCGAKAKGTGKPCRSRPVSGSTRCKMHGGYNYGRPKTKGKQTPRAYRDDTSQYVKKSVIPAAFAAARQLDTHEGRVDVIKTIFGLTSARAEQLPQTPEAIEVWLKSAAQMSKDVVNVHELEKKEAPTQQAPTFVINTHQDQNQSFMGRSSDGSSCLIQPLGDKLYMLEEATGALWPVTRAVDKGTGAEIFVKMLSGSAE